MKKLGRALAAYLSRPRMNATSSAPTPMGQLSANLSPGDVLLVEGLSQISSAVKYLTQSNWSHAALYVGAFRTGVLDPDHCFVEADLIDGVRCVGFSTFEGLHTRICRPIGLADAERRAVVEFAIARIGRQYDLRNVFDLARYLLPTPPVPTRFRRRMIALGSGDPTRAICSTLIAQAFQSIRYPILPTVERRPHATEACADCHEEILHIRHHSLYAPRDFDVSPYFEIVKPNTSTFDFRTLHWDDHGLAGAPSSPGVPTGAS